MNNTNIDHFIVRAMGWLAALIIAVAALALLSILYLLS